MSPTGRAIQSCSRCIIAQTIFLPCPRARRRATSSAGHSLLRQLFGSIGPRTWVEAPFYCDYGENIRIGSDCFINANCVFLDCNTITIGSNVLFGPAVQLYTVTHPLTASERLQFDDPEDPARSRYVTQAMPITIGNDAWIGGGAIVMPGVSIGARTTIGAGSVVTELIPDDSLAAGNPCRVLRRLA